MPKRVLFLTYFFPPLGGVASIRSGKFARYLPESGWEPIVFHAGQGNHYLQDQSLLEEIPPHVVRIPARTLEGAPLFRALAALHLRFVSYRIQHWIPIDPQVGWLPGLLSAVRRYVQVHGKPDALFTSSAPFSVNVAGLILHKELGIPWVADFRDEWTLNPGVQFPTSIHRKLAVKYESATIAQAEALTTVTQSLVEQFQKMRPAHLRPADLIRNGFDETDFTDVPVEKLKDKWTLGIIGTVYAQTDPAVVLEILAELIRTGEIPPDDVRVVHAGSGSVKWPAHFGAERMALGFVSHATAIQWMRRVHLLILTIQRAEAAGTRIYEHMRSATPILAVTPQGEASHLIETTATGIVVLPERKDLIRQTLLASYTNWKTGVCVPSGNSRITEFSRRAQAIQLASVLDDVTNRGCNPGIGR